MRISLWFLAFIRRGIAAYLRLTNLVNRLIRCSLLRRLVASSDDDAVNVENTVTYDLCNMRKLKSAVFSTRGTIDDYRFFHKHRVMHYLANQPPCREIQTHDVFTRWNRNKFLSAHLSCDDEEVDVTHSINMYLPCFLVAGDGVTLDQLLRVLALESRLHVRLVPLCKRLVIVDGMLNSWIWLPNDPLYRAGIASE